MPKSAPPQSEKSLFRFTFSHLPSTSQGELRRPGLKIFGFFDLLRIEEVGHPVPLTGLAEHDPDLLSGDRHQRTLLAFGDQRKVWDIYKRGRNKRRPAYVAVCLIKLSGKSAHERFARTVRNLKPREADETYLSCLDAPDVVILKTFANERRLPGPLERLVTWMEKLTRKKPFKGKIERSLTMVACRDIPVFKSKLAPADAGSQARAHVRLIDTHNGSALDQLCQSLSKTLIPGQLRTSAGYYDVQAMLSIPDAATLLTAAAPFVRRRLINSSTCILGAHLPGQPPALREPDAELLKSLLRAWKRLYRALKLRESENCLKASTRAVAAEVVSRFRRLHSSGLVPGSRLLLWTCRDALLSFAIECEDHWVYRSRKETAAHDSEFYVRQGHYGVLFRAICDELDRRVSLSLAAHTRFFPCSIEVPLKVIGALDMIGRLTVASFRCYRCRQGRGILQVFTALSDKPSQFEFLQGRYAFRKTGSIVPSMMVTTFSPRMARHFYFAMFTVLHEVGQCVFMDTIQTTSFSAVVLGHAYVERLALLGTLLSAPRGAPRQVEIPKFVHRWTAEFLSREVPDTRWWNEEANPEARPDYFRTTRIPRGQEPTTPDIGGLHWQTKVQEWRLSRIKSKDKESALECFRLFRDVHTLALLTETRNSRDFILLWQHELLAHFGSLPEEIVSQVPDQIGRPMTHARKMGDLMTDYQRWSRACLWDEYIELASFIPFLRLFELESDGSVVLEAFVKVIYDHANVYQDSEEPSGAFDSARRFLVAFTTLDVLREQRTRKEPLGDCLGSTADKLIAKCVQRSAEMLLNSADCLPKGHTRKTCIEVWKNALHPELACKLEADFAYGAEVAQPMILKAMVRFLVRLMYVYSVHGPNIGRGQRDTLITLSRKFREILSARAEAGNGRIPARHVADLWTLQYQLTEANVDTDYRFPLRTAIARWRGTQ